MSPDGANRSVETLDQVKRRLWPLKYPHTAAQTEELSQRLLPQRDAIVAGLLHLLLLQLKGSVVTPLGEELLAVAHLKAAFHCEAFAVGVALQDEERRVRRDDLILLGQSDDVLLDRIGTTLFE